MRSPHASIGTEIVGFLAVGSVGFLVDFGLFNAALAGGWSPFFASIGAFTAAVMTTFVGNRYLTFRDRPVDRGLVAFTKFVGISLATLLIVQVGVVLADWLSDSAIVLNVGRLLAVGVAMVIRFLAYRRWVFPRMGG